MRGKVASKRGEIKFVEREQPKAHGVGLRRTRKSPRSILGVCEERFLKCNAAIAA